MLGWQPVAGQLSYIYISGINAVVSLRCICHVMPKKLMHLRAKTAHNHVEISKKTLLEFLLKKIIYIICQIYSMDGKGDTLKCRFLVKMHSFASKILF